LAKEGFPRKKVLKIIFSLGRFPQKMNDVFYQEDKDEEKTVCATGQQKQDKRVSRFGPLANLASR